MRNPYTCIFKRTLASRIWSLSPTTRCVWLWLKLQADPEGYVSADLAGVAAGANVPAEDARRAIEGFCSPDPDADPDDPHEGRVLERVRGGWLILDHESERELAKTETRNARNARYARARRAREANERAANDVEPTGVPADAPVAPCTTRSKPTTTTTPTTGGEDSPSPLPPSEAVDPERLARRGASMAVPLHSLPDDFEPSPELRADAQMAGITNLDERIKSLETGPIGGTRGVLPHKLEDYIRSFFGKWKTWEETDRAKARAAAAAPASSRRGPPAAPIPEPKAKHRKYAEAYGLNLQAAIDTVVALRVHESGGEPSFYRHLERALSEQKKARAA